jgi:hypothetical protein
VDYVAPSVTDLGTVEEVTLAGCKALGEADGYFLVDPDQPLTNCS